MVTKIGFGRRFWWFLCVVLAGLWDNVQASDRVVGFERAIYIPAKKPFWKYLESFDNLCMGVLLTPSDVLSTCECMLEMKGTDQRHPSAQTETQNGMRFQQIKMVVTVAFNDVDKAEKRTCKVNVGFLARGVVEVPNPKSKRIISPSILRIRTHEMTRHPSEFINVTEIRLHPRCDGFGGYDYAMSRLKQPASIEIRVTENYFPYSRAAKGIYDEADGMPECYISTYLKERREWNDNSPYKYGGIVMIPVDVADTEECREFINYDPLYVRYDWANKICIEALKMLPICKGDMGVPLICNETLVGITTANSAFCDWNSSLNIVSSLSGAWEFIDDFIKTGGMQYWKNKAQEVLNSIKGMIE